jgi:polysaccharide export outer membrane protein
MNAIVGGHHAGEIYAPAIKKAVHILLILTLSLTQSAIWAQDRPPQYMPGQTNAPSTASPQTQQQPDAIPGQDALSSPIPALGASDSTYRLASADIVRVNIFNQPDLSGEYQLDGNAQFVMPLIGRIDAKDLTSAELEILLVSKLKPDYLVNPRIFVQVLNYRPYYLIGEAGATGAFPYVAGMTYLVAIAKSGGFSYRAKKKYVYVIRAGDPEQNEIKLSVDEFVQPGDIIRVAERMF